MLSQTRASNPAVGKDLVLDFVVSNVGQVTASNVVLSEPIPAGSTYVWASPGCTLASSTVTCNFGSMPIFTSHAARVVVRPLALGPLVSTATVSATEPESTPYNNSNTLNMAVSSTPAGVPVFRYRLYSPVTLEHHFTTDLNEYTVLGSNGNWNMEGAIGKVLDNPGVYNGVQATPYYRLYNTSNNWHHWTSDPNEYYTLVQFANWSAEGVDGYILPTTTTNATPLYRLLYPFVAGLHHWTTDANEYNTLIGSYGWIGEGGSGFVIQTGAPPGGGG
ncbi:MAG TPA: hypothetical protein VM122_12160, partial [Usitatibacter sp.]|nr:hypothetical protein [Usitatibacter sp.]